ncbi:ependymin [Genypterus blacodes]|uniref:ependymin n=1 Tax=Genypterus blacodes TaxID=154954 RepID=UPI003F76BCD1
MYAVITLFVFLCLAASTDADHHQPCHSPNMTGELSVANLKGVYKAMGAFTFDSTGNKLRFISNESQHLNTSHLDLLVFFDEGILYEIDSKNQSCEKKTLQSTMQPLDVPSDAKFHSALNIGHHSIEGEGLKFNMWTGQMPAEMKGYYVMSTSMGCLPLSAIYFSEPTGLIVSVMDIESEIKDPDLLVLPSFCEGLPVVETVNTFLCEFM